MSGLFIRSRRPRGLRRASSLLPGLALLGASLGAQADVVWLNNGDRLTGSIKSVDGGVLLIGTDYGGDIRVTLEQVRTFESEQALVVLDNAGRRQHEARFTPAAPGQVTMQDSQTELSLTDLDTLARPNPILLDTAFKGRIDLSANRKSASSDTEDIAAAAELEARRNVWRHQINASYARSKDDNSVNTNNYGANYTLDRFISQNAFWQGRLQHKHDQIEELSRQTALGTGPGYQFWDDELGAFSLATLIERIRYGYSDHSHDRFYAASVRWNYNRYFRGQQFEVYTRGELSRPLGDSRAKYAINAEAGLRYKVTDWMSLYLKYQRNRIDAHRETLNESIYGTGIGVTW